MTATWKAPAAWALPPDGMLVRVPDGPLLMIRPTRLRDFVRLPHRMARRRA